MKTLMRRFYLLAAFGVAIPVMAQPSRPLPPHLPPPTTPDLPRHAVAMTLPWSEGFETGGATWTTHGFFHVVTDPQLHHVMSPTIYPNLVTLPDAGTLPAAHGGNHSLWYGELVTGTFVGADFDHAQPPLSGGTSRLPNIGWAITPDLDLTVVADATLSFWTVWEVEGVDIPWYDLMYIEASVDAGATWSPVGGGALNPLNDVNTATNIGYSSGGIGMPPVWVQHAFPLTNFCGNICWLRFRFDTIDELYNGFRGWFIDDISVVETGQSLGPIITDVIPGAGQPGDVIYVHGTNFQSGATIDVSGLITESVVLSNALAQFIVPDLPEGDYDIGLTNPDGQFDVCTGCFEITLVSGPQISFIDPNWAYPGIPTPIIIEGQNFDPGAVVSIGGQLATDIVVVTQERITCTTPGTLGLGFHLVRVTNPDGQFAQCLGCFEVRIPEPPTDVVIQQISNDIHLNWRPAPWDGAEYRIFRDTDVNGPFTLMVGDVPDTFFVDNNVLNDPDIRFFYIVKAYVP